MDLYSQKFSLSIVPKRKKRSIFDIDRLEASGYSMQADRTAVLSRGAAESFFELRGEIRRRTEIELLGDLGHRDRPRRSCLLLFAASGQGYTAAG